MMVECSVAAASGQLLMSRRAVLYCSLLLACSLWTLNKHVTRLMLCFLRPMVDSLHSTRRAVQQSERGPCLQAVTHCLLNDNMVDQQQAQRLATRRPSLPTRSFKHPSLDGSEGGFSELSDRLAGAASLENGLDSAEDVQPNSARSLVHHHPAMHSDAPSRASCIEAVTCCGILHKHVSCMPAASPSSRHASACSQCAEVSVAVQGSATLSGLAGPTGSQSQGRPLSASEPPSAALRRVCCPRLPCLVLTGMLSCHCCLLRHAIQ